MTIKLSLTEFEARLVMAAIEYPDLAHIGDCVYNRKGDADSGLRLQRIYKQLRSCVGDGDPCAGPLFDYHRNR